MDPAILNDPILIFQKLGISLLLGLLVGLQRQYASSDVPGLRTFALITVLGTVAALLAVAFGGWVVVAGFVAMIGVMAGPNIVRIRGENPNPGTTTDVAVLLMYAVGAFLVVGPIGVAVAVGGGVAVLLQFKVEMHGFVKKLGDDDLKAIMQFVLITCIVLPVLPNRTFGPLDVLNPFETWLMVVLIVGMSLGGYTVYKFLGRDAGIMLGGVLGGAISSTATTVSYARQGGTDRSRAGVAAIVIMIASTVVFGRVLIEIAVVSPDFLRTAAPPVLVLMLLTATPALALWCRVRSQPSEMPEQKNPTQLKSALLFGAMYAVVLLALAAAEQYTDGQALYPVAILSGLTDMDAITLSTARMSKVDPEIAADGWRLIVAASLANLVFKAGIVGMLGGRQLLVRISLLFSIPMLGGLAMLFFWPW